jgi:DNA polymerase-3 subunit alpha
MRRGIRILPPHVNSSDVEWTTQAKAIRAGLNIIKGLSFNTIDTIIRARCAGPFTSLDDLRNRVRFRRPELESLVHVGACDGLGPSHPAMLMRLHFAPPNPNQLLLFDMYADSSRSKCPQYSRTAKLKAEVDLTGIPFTMHPALLLRIRHTPAARLGQFINKQVTVAGCIATARRARTNDGRIMGFVTLEDSSGLAEVTFFPDKISQYRSLCSASGLVWTTGKVTNHLSSITIEARSGGRAAHNVIDDYLSYTLTTTQDLDNPECLLPVTSRR